MRRLPVAAALAPVVVAGSLVAAALATHPDPQASACDPVGAPVAVAGVPEGSVAGWSGEQLGNAALVMQAGEALGVDARGQVIGVMTAMGESSLTVLDHGDAAGPDSRGLFQQRANGAWGSYEDRMDPTTSATNFFRALLQVEGWQTLPPTIAAHRTQRNADPYHYARWWDDALEVAAALSGATVPGLAPGTGSLPCTGAAPLVRTVTGDWTTPADGPLTSGYGQRDDPTGDGVRLHAGLDLAPGCDAPVVAASGGVVVRAGPSSGYGNLVVVDHGDGVVTRYAHMEDDDLLVVVGQPVVAGQQVARVGTKGDSTGCHLHFEVLVDGVATDPLAFLTERGTDLR
ncbi:M23 family metallopeptidase [Geodermatophilus sp. DF01-2]|uniref:M23 family metallopeptidase n=1 Tax=Geodermatophilus sp. DF01-2 TaxID=2559610 RepID=UPI0010735321|nr:M23 family metallopeptidase [Geodermatophilus sp. DF01_2]TFV63060.1 M23 family metallopeptidase [Geodermatophilus sp. DF01_2]